MVDGSEGCLRAQTISLQAYRRRIAAREPLTYVDTFMAAINRPNVKSWIRHRIPNTSIAMSRGLFKYGLDG